MNDRDEPRRPVPDRWCPDRAFPPYAFVPGRNPHPTRDPRGHSYARHDSTGHVFTGHVFTGHDDASSRSPRIPPDRWREDEAWLYGVDLYNHGYAWEAHESWEARWLAPHDDEQEQFVQALVQVAAAALKTRMGEPRGADRLARLALEKLAATSARAAGLAVVLPAGVEGSVDVPRRYMGLDVHAFASVFRAWSVDAARTFASRPRLDLA